MQAMLTAVVAYAAQDWRDGRNVRKMNILQDLLRYQYLRRRRMSVHYWHVRQSDDESC